MSLGSLQVWVDRESSLAGEGRRTPEIACLKKALQRCNDNGDFIQISTTDFLFPVLLLFFSVKSQEFNLFSSVSRSRRGVHVPLYRVIFFVRLVM